MKLRVKKMSQLGDTVSVLELEAAEELFANPHYAVAIAEQIVKSAAELRQVAKDEFPTAEEVEVILFPQLAGGF